ncbi:ABC transporter substrate-binding protein [Allobacillus sp. GCM10007491]|uniref:ABC transporter substrate-binding protein n=1 Tax=Allobacillus saliphilus TaxID=2912308 RepID=A0A941CTP7_9BACI|nr:ABC transporter substrate-binding protein [Allobacillus saliphilus]MBR7552530.1 ABC transporter substrate-binding protein [Allobacillus saliphilus]
MSFKRILLMLLFVSVIALVACQGDDDTDVEADTESSGEESSGSSDSETSESDGGSTELTLAYDTIPPSLDPHMSTATGTTDFALQIYETLFSIDSDYVAQPMLAASSEMSDDNQTLTIELREGVMFHNGEEMTAEDVVASMNRWKEISTKGQANLSDATFEANGDYEVVLKMNKPEPLIVNILAHPEQAPAIMPKEVIDNATAEGVSEYVGTGPFKVEEYVDTQSLHLKKFEDYSALDSESDGLVGNKTAKVDEILIDIVTDETIRFSGLQTGEYDIATRLSYDNVDQLQSEEGLKEFAEAFGFQGMFFNKANGFFTDNKARKAVNAALNMDDILTAAYVSPDYYSADNSLVNSDQALWHSDAGSDQYNQDNPEKAKELLDEAGYGGEEIVILATREYPTHYQAAIVIQSQLEDLGMNVSLEVYDWATLLEHRENPESWDIFVSGFNFDPDPANAVYLHSENEYAGWNESDEIDRLVEEINQSESQDEATELFHELQEEVWDYLPFILFGHHKPLHGLQSNVEGFDINFSMVLWNLEKK